LGTDGVWTYGGLTPPATVIPITETQPPTTIPTPTTTVQLTVTPGPPVTATLLTTLVTPTTTITSTVPSRSAQGSKDISSTNGNSPSTTPNTHIFPSVYTTTLPTPSNPHTYLGLPPDSFLGLVIGISFLVLLSLCCCLAAIFLCWRRRRRDRPPNGLTRAERRALLKTHQPLPDPSDREKDASFVANLANSQTSRLLAGDRSPRDRSFAKANAPRKEMRKSEVALMRARGELPEWNDVLGLSPSLNHPRLPDEDPSIAYGVHPSELNDGGGGTSQGLGDRTWAAADIDNEVGSHMRGDRSRNTSLRVANMPPPPVLRHNTSVSSASGNMYHALPQRPNLGVEPPIITTTRPGQTRHHRLESVDSMVGVPESIYYASGVPVGASVAARKSTDELDKELHSVYDAALDFDIDGEVPGVDLADLTERGATPTGSSSDPHLQPWFIDDLNDEPPTGILGRARSTHSSDSGRSTISRRTRNLDNITRTAMAYLERPVSQTGERSRLAPTPSNVSSPSVSALSPITRYDSPVERTEDIQNLAALPPAGHSPPRSRAGFSNRDSGLGQWVNRNRQLDSRVPEQPRTPLFQRLFDPILTRVRTVSQSTRNRPQTPPVGNTPRPQEYSALPPEPGLEEKSSGEISGRPTRDWNWKAGPTSYSSGASTSKDDFRKWGRMGGSSSAAPRSSYGGGSALRQSLIFGGGSNSQGGSRTGLSGDEEADRAERGEGSGLGLGGVPPVLEEQDITSAAPLLRDTATPSPHSPPRAPIREHAEFGLRPPLPPAPVDHRSSQFSSRTAGSQATQGTAYFDAKSTLASSARDTARGPSPLGQTAWSAQRSLAGTPMLEPYPVGPQDIPSTSTSTPVQEVSVVPQEQDEPHELQGITPSRSPIPPFVPIPAPTPPIQYAQPVDVLDVQPPPATREFRQQPSLSTVFSVGSLEALHESLGMGQPEVVVADHGRRRSSSIAGAGHRQFGSFSVLDDSERFPPPGLVPNPRLSYQPSAPPVPESRPPSYGQAQPRPRSVGVVQVFQEQLRRLSQASNGAGSQGSATSSYGDILPGGILSERNQEGDDLEEDPPMAASQWRVLRGYRRVSNVPDRGGADGSGTDSSAALRLGVGPRQRTISAWQAEEQANYRLTLGQVRVRVV